MAKKKKAVKLTLGRALRAAKTIDELNAVVAKLSPPECHAMRSQIKKAADRIIAAGE